MRQYILLKEKFPDAILFFRMGDFYELFLEDAQVAAPLMDVALTARQGGVPMAGVPYHSADLYLSRLLQAGHKVAVAEQEADPDNPKLMNRVVKRVLSAGTLIEDSLLKSSDYNYLMAAVVMGEDAAAAFVDVSTGVFFSYEHKGQQRGNDGDSAELFLRDLFTKYAPGELICSVEQKDTFQRLFHDFEKQITPLEHWKSSPVEGIRRLKSVHRVDPAGLGYRSQDSVAPGAISLIYHYLQDSFQGEPVNLDPPVLRKTGSSRMELDEQTIRNLDLIRNLREGGTERTLFRVLDATVTVVGKRKLKDELLSPLLDPEQIRLRYEAVQFFLSNQNLASELRSLMSGISDLERILGRAASGRGQPADLGSIRDTIEQAIRMKGVLQSRSSLPGIIQNVLEVEESLVEYGKQLKSSLEAELPAIRGGGPVFVSSCSKKLADARKANEEGEKWIVDFELREREKTGISTLKVKYNRVAGYFVEVSKMQAKNVPENYIRRQTLVGSERYSCTELEALEEKILGSEQEIQEEEDRLFRESMDGALAKQRELRQLMREIAGLDFYIALATRAKSERWVQPELNEGDELEIVQGRHPVVEYYQGAGEAFHPNDLLFQNSEERFAIITGPNMSGKSTFIRQVALIQILAQIGSFVPAQKAKLPVVDQVFTRIGAGDNLTRGESTFYVEMLETSRILNRCTERSLVIMDEVGRGTSTFDGLSIAWAVVEYLTEKEKRPFTLFATHYHELTALADRNGIFNLTIDVEETDGKIIFLHKVKKGAADRSYGVHVARLAGLPEEVIGRAEEKMKELEEEMARLRERASLRKERKRDRSLEQKKREDQPGLF